MPAPSPISLKDGSTVYRVQFRVDRRLTSERFNTLKEARRFCDLIDRVGAPEARALLDAADDMDPEDLTCTGAFNEYIEHVCAHAQRGTIEKYERVWKRYIEPTFGLWPIASITRRMVEKWITRLRSTPRLNSKGETIDGEFLSGKTIANAHGLFSAILSLQVQRGALDINVAKGVKLPAAQKTKAPVFLTPIQRHALIVSTRKDFRPLIRLLLATGMRWSEATALQWQDFSFSADIVKVSVTKAWKKQRGGYVIGPPKTPKSVRQIPIPTSLALELEEASHGFAPTEFAFQGPNGRLKDAWFRTHIWDPALEAAKIYPAPRIHDLRHTYASMLLAEGVPIHFVQSMLGHESIQTTVNVYGHLTPGADKATVEAITRALADALPVKV